MYLRDSVTKMKLLRKYFVAQHAAQKRQHASIWLKGGYAFQRKDLHAPLREDPHGSTAGHLQGQECNDGFIKNVILLKKIILSFLSYAGLRKSEWRLYNVLTCDREVSTWTRIQFNLIYVQKNVYTYMNP